MPRIPVVFLWWYHEVHFFPVEANLLVIVVILSANFDFWQLSRYLKTKETKIYRLVEWGQNAYRWLPFRTNNTVEKLFIDPFVSNLAPFCFIKQVERCFTCYYLPLMSWNIYMCMYLLNTCQFGKEWAKC